MTRIIRRYALPILFPVLILLVGAGAWFIDLLAHSFNP